MTSAMTAGGRETSAVSAPEASVEQPAGPGVGLPRFVVVPRTPGPIRTLRRARPNDDADVDAAIDDLFGDVTNEQPGRFDVGLLIVGAGLVAWWVVSAMTGPGLVLGVISIVLGLALPTRNAIRVANRRWTGVQDQRAMRQGYPLDVGDPTVAALVRAYEGVLRVTTGSHLSRANEAVDAAHRAVVEVASLLGTGRPTAAADTKYVRERTRAITGLTASLSAAADSLNRSGRLLDTARSVQRADMRGAVAEAREQLDASTGMGSIPELEALAERIDTEAGHGRRA